MQKPEILGFLEYSEPFYNCIPTHIQNPVILTTIYEHSKLRHIFNPAHIQNPLKDLRWSFLQKIVKNFDNFSKVHFRSFIGFWIHPSLNKYSLTCRVTLYYVLYDTYSEPCLLLKIQPELFRHIHILFSHIAAYLEPCITLAYSEPSHIRNPCVFRSKNISRTLCNARILRTLPYLELRYIQNFGMFRTRGIFRILFI